MSAPPRHHQPAELSEPTPARRRAGPGADDAGRAAGWGPLVVCCLGTFLLLLYTSIVTVALPGIGTDLHAGFGAQQWVIDVYTLALAGLLLGAGALSDALGARRLYLHGLAVFTTATLGCGLAPSSGWLIGARAAQGIAGAAMLAGIMPLIGLTYTEPRRRATAFAVWGAVAGAASAVGTVCGGVLAEYAGWRWMFLGALPLCVLTLALAARTLPSPPSLPPPAAPARAGRGVDWPGTALVTITVSALAYAVITAGQSGRAVPGPVFGWVAAGAAGIGFVLVERVARQPILPMGLFAAPRFVAVLPAAFGYYFAAFGALPGISTWMQTRLGLGSLGTSLVLVVQLVVFIAVSGLVSNRLHGLHPGWTLGGGTAVVGLGGLAGAALMTGTGGGAGWPALLPFLVLSGLGAGVVSPVLPAVAMAAVPARYAGTSGAAANSVRQLGLALGVAVCGTLTRTSTAAGVATALAVCGALALLAGTVAALLLRRRASGER